MDMELKLEDINQDVSAQDVFDAWMGIIEAGRDHPADEALIGQCMKRLWGVAISFIKADDLHPASIQFAIDDMPRALLPMLESEGMSAAPLIAIQNKLRECMYSTMAGAAKSIDAAGAAKADDWITVTQAARLLTLPESNIDPLVKSGKLIDNGEQYRKRRINRTSAAKLAIELGIKRHKRMDD